MLLKNTFDRFTLPSLKENTVCTMNVITHSFSKALSAVEAKLVRVARS